jgi:hypothetical protein
MPSTTRIRKTAFLGDGWLLLAVYGYAAEYKRRSQRRHAPQRSRSRSRARLEGLEGPPPRLRTAKRQLSKRAARCGRRPASSALTRRRTNDIASGPSWTMAQTCSHVQTLGPPALPLPVLCSAAEMCSSVQVGWRRRNWRLYAHLQGGGGSTPRVGPDSTLGSGWELWRNHWERAPRFWLGRGQDRPMNCAKHCMGWTPIRARCLQHSFADDQSSMNSTILRLCEEHLMMSSPLRPPGHMLSVDAQA